MQEGVDVSIKGVCPVLAVPFTEDGRVDFESFRSLCRWIIGLNTKSVLLFGVGSENIKLNDEERIQLLDILLSEREGTSLKVVTSIADHSSELAVLRAKKYEEMGVDFINILPPTFFSPSNEQINFHISQVLRSVKLPVIVQHLPQAGGSTNLAEILDLTTEHDNLKIIKCEANPPTESIRTVHETTSGRVRTLIGWGGICWSEGVDAGADGLQPGSAMTDLYLWAQKSLDKGDRAEFEARISRFIPRIANWISNLEQLIAAEKYILMRRGIITTGYCRTPTIALNPAIVEEIAHILQLCEEIA